MACKHDNLDSYELKDGKTNVQICSSCKIFIGTFVNPSTKPLPHIFPSLSQVPPLLRKPERSMICDWRDVIEFHQRPISSTTTITQEQKMVESITSYSIIGVG